jgi:predicted dithiol-disulfide oxidoreductase (DUF899 family)
MSRPEVVSIEDWRDARSKLLVVEKEVTRATDVVAARRRRLPMVAFRNDYVFAGPDGDKSLLELFGECTQLLVYQFMDRGPDEFCPGCTWFTNNVPVNALEALAKNDVAWATVSNMPLAQIEGYKNQKGWTLPFYSSNGTTFSDDCGAGPGFLLSAFVRYDDDVYLTYTTSARGVDHLLFANVMLDLVVYGRKEEWEDSPPGWPQGPTYG